MPKYFELLKWKNTIVLLLLGACTFSVWLLLPLVLFHKRHFCNTSCFPSSCDLFLVFEPKHFLEFLLHLLLLFFFSSLSCTVTGVCSEPTSIDMVIGLLITCCQFRVCAALNPMMHGPVHCRQFVSI